MAALQVAMVRHERETLRREGAETLGGHDGIAVSDAAQVNGLSPHQVA